MTLPVPDRATWVGDALSSPTDHADGEAPSGGDDPRQQEASAPAELDLRTLFERHYPSVWRLLRRFGVSEAHLDDAAQEVFWVTARRLSEIHPGRESSFLYGVALRVASNEIRRGKSTPAMTDIDDISMLVDPRPSPEEQVDQRLARKLLDLALDRMPTELRRVFVLFELEGLEVREIAELEDLPVGTASSRLRRAREEFSAIVKRLHAALATRGRQR